MCKNDDSDDAAARLTDTPKALLVKELASGASDERILGLLGERINLGSAVVASSNTYFPLYFDSHLQPLFPTTKPG